MIDQIRFEKFSSLIKMKTGKLLDIGCKDGSFANYIPKLDYYGIDVDEKSLKEAREVGLKVIKQDLDEGLPFPKNFFDYVIAGEIIEHLINPENLVKEAKRVLKDNGVFIGSTPNAFSWRRRLEVLFGFLRYEPTTTEHIRFFNLSSLKKLLNRHFDKVTITTFTPIKVWKSLLATSFIWKCKK